MMGNTTPETNAGSCTRSGAKRRRLKRRARAIRSGDDAGGVWGSGTPSSLSTAWDATLSRGDLSLLRTAIRRDWGIGERQRLAFVDLTWATFERVADIPRHSIAVARTVLEMSAANQRDERRELAELFSIDERKPA